jgi:hypothetical protein
MLQSVGMLQHELLVVPFAVEHHSSGSVEGWQADRQLGLKALQMIAAYMMHTSEPGDVMLTLLLLSVLLQLRL